MIFHALVFGIAACTDTPHEESAHAQRVPTSHLSGVNILPVDRPQEGGQVAAQTVSTQEHSHGTHPLEDRHSLHMQKGEAYACCEYSMSNILYHE